MLLKYFISKQCHIIAVICIICNICKHKSKPSQGHVQDFQVYLTKSITIEGFPIYYMSTLSCVCVCVFGISDMVTPELGKPLYTLGKVCKVVVL